MVDNHGMPSDRLPRHARPFVAGLVVALCTCAAVPLNEWPFSSWELFSRLRSDHQTALSLVDGAHGRVLAAQVQAYGRVPLRAFVAESATRKRATCAAWRRASGDAGELTVYRVDWRLSERSGSRAAAPRRTLVWTCRRPGAR